MSKDRITTSTFRQPCLVELRRALMVRYVPLPCTAKSAKRPQTIILTCAFRPTCNMPALCAERLRTHINKRVKSPRVHAFTWNKTQNGETNTRRRFCITSVIVPRAHVNHHIRLHTISVAKSIASWRALNPECS